MVVNILFCRLHSKNVKNPSEIIGSATPSTSVYLGNALLVNCGTAESGCRLGTFKPPSCCTLSDLLGTLKVCSIPYAAFWVNTISSIKFKFSYKWISKYVVKFSAMEVSLIILLIHVSQIIIWWIKLNCIISINYYGCQIAYSHN